MPPISPDQEFHFGLEPDAPIGTPFSLGDDVALPTHRRIYSQGDKVKADLCPSIRGTVIGLGMPLDKQGKSYVSTAACNNPSCDFKITLRA